MATPISAYQAWANLFPEVAHLVDLTLAALHPPSPSSQLTPEDRAQVALSVGTRLAATPGLVDRRGALDADRLLDLALEPSALELEILREVANTPTR